jgi:hypothetical protein
MFHFHFPFETLFIVADKAAESMRQEPVPPLFKGSMMGDAEAERRALRWIFGIKVFVGVILLAFVAFAIWALAF